jgi:hypothetical protein
VATRSKAWIVFSLSNIWIVGSNPTRCMDVYPRFFCVCVVLCRWRTCDGLIPRPRSPADCFECSYFQINLRCFRSQRLILMGNRPQDLIRKGGGGGGGERNKQIKKVCVSFCVCKWKSEKIGDQPLMSSLGSRSSYMNNGKENKCDNTY